MGSWALEPRDLTRMISDINSGRPATSQHVASPYFPSRISLTTHSPSKFTPMSFLGSKVHVKGDAINDVRRDQYNAGRDQVNILNLNLDDPNKVRQFLARKAATSAFLDAEQRYPPPNCHLGTRTRILGKIGAWIEDGSKPGRVFWLYGSAGVGKSAIAQTLGEKYVGSKLAAAFFFSRNDSTRDNLAPFVASIVYQFSKSDQLWSVLGPKIIEAIRLDPNVFDTTVENQFQKLIIDPCSQMDGVEWEDSPNVIIIDGLDECLRSCIDLSLVSTQTAVRSRPPPPQERPQERLLALIQSVAAHVPAHWVFLVFSRPEPQIRRAFAHFGMILTELAVTLSPEVHRDIRKYFIDHFTKLRREHPALRDDALWPSDGAINQLVDRADGQFIFAVTVIKFIDVIDELPQDRLETIFRIYVDCNSDSPYSDLDLLYHEILSHCQRMWKRVQPILCLLATPHHVRGSDKPRIQWRSPSMITLLLNLKMGEVMTLLSRLHSVLHIPNGDSNIQIAHASFAEFLSDKARSVDYYTPQMPESEYCDLIATFLFHNLSTLSSHYPPSHMQCNVPATWSSWKNLLESDLMEYSCQHWDDYCVVVEAPSPNLLAELNAFDPYCVLAALVQYSQLYARFFWDKVIDWARSIGESTKDFVSICESFVQGFCLDFLPNISQEEAFWFTFQLETVFWRYGSRHMNYFQVTFLQQLYSVELATVSKYPGNLPASTIIILPANGSSQMRLPVITKTNKEVFKRISHVFCEDDPDYEDYSENSDIHALISALLHDVRHNTCKTVLQKLIQEDDLVHFKQLLKERRELFFPEFTDWPPSPSAAIIGDHYANLLLSDSTHQNPTLPMPSSLRALPLLNGTSEEIEKQKAAPSDKDTMCKCAIQ